MNNVWTIFNDQYRYPDPRRFEPDRYKHDTNSVAETATHVNPAVRDHFIFGAGRRMCPGSHVAERSLFIAMSRLLWAFDFLAVNGKEPDANGLRQGIVMMPEPFEADIRAREGKADLVKNIWQEAQKLLDEDGQWK